MNSDSQKLIINSLVGGKGDIWMRLVSLYAFAGILPSYEINLIVPGSLKKLAQSTFGDRLVILDESETDSRALVYTHLGMVDLVKGISLGKKYISPYQRSVIHDKKRRHLKDKINTAIFTIADMLGVVQVPAWKWITKYQGYLDVIAIKKLRNVSYDEYIEQLQKDYGEIFLRLNKDIPASENLKIPFDLKGKILVFATGTGRQFVPVWWAKQYLPDAYYAFFYGDGEAARFIAEGLNVVYFYDPADIIKLSQHARWTISTDSFPSHLLQYSSATCTVTITGTLRSRIVSPVFRGEVVESQVACHPCLHLDRKNHPLCAAGYSECQNWKNKIYTDNILHSIKLPYSPIL